MCRSQCKNFDDIGRQYRAVDDTVEYRAGDSAEFTCIDGFHVSGELHDVRTVTKVCQDNGMFASETRPCDLTPCTENDKWDITPIEGDFRTDDSGDVDPAEKIYFTCANDSMVII